MPQKHPPARIAFSTASLTSGHLHLERVEPTLAPAGCLAAGRGYGGGMDATITLGDAEVARIGLGTNRLRNTPENVAFVQQAAEAGIGYVDTAHTYTNGESEATIG